MSFRNLNFSPSTSTLLKLFFPFTDITRFFLSLKHQYCRTIVLLNFSKKPLFQKRRWSCDFPPIQTPVAQNHRTISRQEKMAFSTPHRVVLVLPFPSPRACTGGARTLTSQPKFLRSIGYQICLAMELHWRALPAASTITLYSKANILSIRLLHDLLAGSACFLIPHFQSFLVRRGKFL